MTPPSDPLIVPLPAVSEPRLTPKLFTTVYAIVLVTHYQRLLNYIVAIYLIAIGLIGLLGAGGVRLG